MTEPSLTLRVGIDHPAPKPVGISAERRESRQASQNSIVTAVTYWALSGGVNKIPGMACRLSGQLAVSLHCHCVAGMKESYRHERDQDEGWIGRETTSGF
jgi:hypothetical protein